MCYTKTMRNLRHCILNGENALFPLRDTFQTRLQSSGILFFNVITVGDLQKIADFVDHGERLEMRFCSTS